MDCEALNKLTRRELQTLFYVGRKLRLVDCYLGKTDKARTVKEQKSYGYVMATDDGRASYMRFEPGNYILGKTCGNGYYEIGIYDSDDKLAAKYELL